MIVVLMGIAGSGKTTIGRLLAARTGWLFHDGDDDHTPQNKDKMRRGIPLQDEDREAWIGVLRGRIAGWLEANEDVVVACSALRSTHRSALMVDPKRMMLVHLVAPAEEIRERVRARAHPFFHESLIDSQLRAMQAPTDAMVVDTTQSPEQVVDRIVEQLRDRAPRR